MLQEINNFLHTLNSEEGVHDNTISSYKYDINQFKHFLIKKKKSFKETKVTDIEDFLEYLKLEKKMNKTIARKIFALKSFYKFLLSEKLISQNPMEKIETPKPEFTVPKTLSVEEIKKILETVSKKNDDYKNLRTYLIVELLYATGARVSELISIKLNNIDLDNSTILVEPPQKGKTRIERIVFFGSQTKFVLEKYLEFRKIEFTKTDDSPWLFPSNSRAGYLTRRTVLNILLELENEVKIKKNSIHPHAFRHAFGNHLLTSGADIRVVQKLLGHSSITTTQTYTFHRHKLIKAIEDFHPLSKNNENII